MSRFQPAYFQKCIDIPPTSIYAELLSRIISLRNNNSSAVRTFFIGPHKQYLHHNSTFLRLFTNWSLSVNVTHLLRVEQLLIIEVTADFTVHV